MSVVITAYNTAAYLPETLDSVFAQSYPSYEVIVVDDGSTDDTVARAREFGNSIQLILRAHEGLGAARNAGIACATGDYVAFLDSDDLWDVETLRTQLAVASRHPSSGLVVADGVHFGTEQAPYARLHAWSISERIDRAPAGEITDWFYRDFVAGNLVQCPAQTLIPRWAVEAMGPVCLTPNGAQDYDYYLRITRSFRATFHGASLARYRLRSDSMSGTPDQQGLRWTSQSIEVLLRERQEFRDGDTQFLDHAIDAHARRAAGFARAAHLRGDRPDPDDLAALYRLNPWDPFVVATRISLALPPWVGRAAVGVVQRCRHVIGELRRGHRRTHR